MLVFRIMEILRKRKAILVLSLFVIITLGLVLELDFSPLILLAFAVIIGWLVSLPLWFLLRIRFSLRTLTHANRKIRWTMIGIVTLFLLPTLFVLYAYLKSYMAVIFYPALEPLHPNLSTWQDAPEFRDFQRSNFDEIVQEHGNLMTKELWLRQLSFPPLRKSCYSSDHVCGLVDDMVEFVRHYYPNLSEYMMTIGISLVFSLPGTLFAWLHTRPPKVESQAKEPIRG